MMVSVVCEEVSNEALSFVGRDAFSKRLYWHDSTASSFTRVRCLSTGCGAAQQVFGSLKKSYTLPPRLNGLDHGRSNEGERREPMQKTASATCSRTGASRTASVESGSSAGVPTTCSACGKTFESTDVVVLFENDVFHVSCFRCGQCGVAVDTSQRFLVLGDGCPLCYDCSPVCHACEQKITSNHVGVLNKDFHEGCLKCFECDKVTEQ